MKAEVEGYLKAIQSRVVPGTLTQYRICLGRFLEFLRKQNLAYEELEAAHLDQFARYLEKKATRRPLGQVRVERHLQVAGLFLHHLYKQQRLLRDLRVHIQPFRPSSPLPFVPSYSQVRRLLALPDPTTPMGLRDRAIFETVYGCGLRLTELHSLALNDIDLNSAVLIIVRGKGGSGRRLPLGRWAAHYLDRYQREARPQLTRGSCRDLWLNVRGRPFSSANSIQQIFIRYERQLDFPVSCHKLRHAFATHLLEGGANLRHLQQLLGHTQITTTERYTRVRPAALKEVHRRAHPRG